jgi:GNAT superfamily N-acetyltransferase
MLRSILNRAEREARLERDGGWSGLLQRELRSKRLKLFAQTDMVFLVDPLDEEPPRVRVPDGIRMEPYAGPHWDLFRELAGPAQRRLYSRRIAAGRKLLVAWRGNEPVGVTWIAGNHTTMALDGMPLDLPQGWCYAYQLYVHPGARGGGLGTALTNARMHYARELGYSRVTRMIRARNTPALRSAAKAKGSTTPAGTAVLYHTLGYKWIRWTSKPELA